MRASLRGGIALLFILIGTETMGGNFAVRLPDFSLKDPAEQSHAKEDLIKQGLIILVTAPILSHKQVQEKWSESLRNTRKALKGQIIFLEDMSVSHFQRLALKALKKDYVIGDEVLPLIDEEGKIREKLGVEKKKPVILVYDSHGKLVHRETGKPDEVKARQIWKTINP